MGNFLSWGACALALGSCTTAVHDSGEAEQLAERRSALEPVAGPELGTNTPDKPVSSSQGSPNLAWDGVNYVVQWLDEGESSTDMSLKAVSIRIDGELQTGPDRANLSTPETPAFSASIASNGGYWLSLWAGADGASHWRIVSSDRRVFGVISPLTEQPLSSAPALAGNGTGFLAVYTTGDSSNGTISGRFLHLESNPASFPIDSSTVNTGPNVFAAAGGGYLVSYSKAGTRLVSVSEAGQVGTSIELSPHVSLVNGATGANTTLVAWTDTSDSQVRARFFAAGQLSGETLVLAENSAGSSPALSWDGSGYFAIWETAEHHLDGRNIASNGTLGPVTPLVNEECFGPVSASDQHGQLLVSYVKSGQAPVSRRVVSRLVGANYGGASGSGDRGGSSSGGADADAGSDAGSDAGAGHIDDGGSGALGTAGGGALGTASGGALGTAGGGNASGGKGDATGESSGNAGVGSKQAATAHCSLNRVGAGQGSRSTAIGYGGLLAALAGVWARRRRRERKLGWR